MFSNNVLHFSTNQTKERKLLFVLLYCKYPVQEVMISSVCSLGKQNIKRPLCLLTYKIRMIGIHPNIIAMR